MKTNLNIATKNLYDVFKKYTIEGNLRDRSCDCCVTDDEIKELLSKDLKLLTEDEIGHFMRSGITTYGEVADYKHFLPRILELMQFDKNGILDDFTTFEKLNYAKWRSWEAQEIEAIQNYFKALWAYTINNENATFIQIEGALDLMAMYVGWDEIFSIWEKAESSHWVSYAVDIVLGNGYYDINGEETERLLNWFSSETILTKIEDVFFKTEDQLEANRISIAYTILQQQSK